MLFANLHFSSLLKHLYDDDHLRSCWCCVNDRIQFQMTKKMLPTSSFVADIKLNWSRSHLGCIVFSIVHSLEMAQAANSPIFGLSAKDFETVCQQF